MSWVKILRVHKIANLQALMHQLQELKPHVPKWNIKKIQELEMPNFAQIENYT